MRRMMFPGRRDKRRSELAERDAIRQALTLEQRLALCDDRPGESRRERARLRAQIAVRETVTSQVETKKDPPKQDKKALKSKKRKEERQADVV